MKTRLTILLFAAFFQKNECFSQTKYDTTIIGAKSYTELTFQLGSEAMSSYEVNETDISIRNGKIEKNKTSRDTIRLRYFFIDDLNEGYEICLSDKTWSKLLFGRQCEHLGEQIENYPSLLMKRNRITKELSFLKSKLVGDFMISNYSKRIECIDSSSDKSMKKYLVEWIKMIENDSIDEFSNALSSHLIHIFSLFDLIVPTNFQDTIITKISNKSIEYPAQFVYQTTKRLNPDSTITYQFTDKVDSEKPTKNQFIENVYEPFKRYYSEEELSINEIRLQSLRSEDKSTIELTKERELTRYLRIMESFMLDSDLNPKYSIYNYEIKKMTTSQ